MVDLGRAWQVSGAGAIGANAEFAGTLMALDAVNTRMLKRTVQLTK